MIWVARLISFALALQTLELFWVPPYRADLLKPEFARGLRWILRAYPILLWLRLVACVAAVTYPCPAVVAVLLFTTWAIAIRWRGTFNGGSDTMTFQIIAAWFVSLAFPQFERGCLYYIAIQLVLSYFIAGLAKLRNREWRNGQAPREFLKRWGYLFSPRASRLLGWTAMGFEILFPLAIFSPWPFLAAGVIFHLGNAYIFGLNRFFFVWIAAYPALLMACAQKL